ncbi:MAG: (d)CMP kinase, partial [Actinobacteria bacterium]|nr:(d)CMP kinase [Actinomycetota bacterium]
MSTDHPPPTSPGGDAGAGGPIVAIDGPAGSGKSTVAGAVATALGVPHLDTGALYRAVTLACLRAGVDLTDPQACEDIARGVVLDRRGGRTFLAGEDVEDEIRGDAVTNAVSTVAAHAGVRAAMTPIQRSVAAASGAVVEGRDIGTVVFPDADLKVFLTASVEERTRRRAEQLGVDPDGLRAEIERRDHQDGTREVAPLQRADDAWELDTTGMDADEVTEAIVDVATAAWRDRTEELPTRLDPVTARRSLPRVAVVGRPNVGKSTLVNRIIGDRVTIVEEKPGITRDRTEHLTSWTDRPFLVVDTGGWEHGAEGMA